MRLVTFTRGGEARIGALVETSGAPDVVDLRAVDPGLPADLLGLLTGGAGALDRARAASSSADAGARLPAASVTLLAPLPRPRTFLCVGYNYVGHGADGAIDLPEFPEIFAKAASCVVGPGAAIVLPRESWQVDYEAELAVVIGTGGRDIAQSEALEHVAGYTIVDDVSARDFQGRGSQWLLGKSFDTFGPMGPCLVTADEVPDPQRLDVELRVNGITMQRANTRDMIFTVRFLVAYISQVMTLEPGDLISTGTPAKLPAAARDQRFLAAGDVVDITIGTLGTLTSPVAARVGAP